MNENRNTQDSQHDDRLFFLKAGLIAAPLLIALAALGCGEQKEKATAELAHRDAAVVPVEQGASAGQGAAATTTALTSGGVVTGVAETTPNADETLPPDIVATGPESVVIPGSVVTIAATGSTDVTSVMLTDRAGEKTPFTYDSESNLWQASYRVPLRVGTEKLALAVTATTEANRYKRVWVFLRLRDEKATPAEAAPDSAQ
ncbi:MAG TPA: hypothetical protein VFM00_07640 [Candidatus Eisenbacteria bacterium]|nr:hypothetical protein [Candidatus Eisenbacteria bacterium]